MNRTHSVCLIIGASRPQCSSGNVSLPLLCHVCANDLLFPNESILFRVYRDGDTIKMKLREGLTQKADSGVVVAC